MATQRNLFTLAVVLMLVSCVSAPSRPEDQPDTVISRIDDLSSRPDWLRESEPFRIESGNVIALGSTAIPGENRVDAGFRIAENNGKALVATAIEQRLEFIFQNAEEGTSIDATQARYIGAESSKVVSSSLRVDKRFWEKVATTLDDGRRVTRYRVFATVSMPEQDFKRAVLDAIRRSNGKGGLSSDFAEKVDSHWDQFIQGAPAK